MVLGTAQGEPPFCKDACSRVKGIKKFLKVLISSSKIRKKCIRNCVIVKDCISHAGRNINNV